MTADDIARMGHNDEVARLPAEEGRVGHFVRQIGGWKKDGALVEDVALLDVVAMRNLEPGIAVAQHRRNQANGSSAGNGLPRPIDFRVTFRVPALLAGGKM